MKPSSTIRLFSIVAYFFIFLQGMIIKIPLGCLLFSGLFEAEPLTRVVIVLADISLLILLIISFGKITKTSLFVVAILYLILLLPVTKIFFSFPFEMFNYFLFLFPAICFLILYPLSVFLSYKEYRRTNMIDK